MSSSIVNAVKDIDIIWLVMKGMALQYILTGERLQYVNKIYLAALLLAWDLPALMIHIYNPAKRSRDTVCVRNWTGLYHCSAKMDAESYESWDTQSVPAIKVFIISVNKIVAKADMNDGFDHILWPIVADTTTLRLDADKNEDRE